MRCIKASQTIVIYERGKTIGQNPPMGSAWEDSKKRWGFWFLGMEWKETKAMPSNQC